MARKTSLLALDVGEKRIGVAIADSSVAIAIAYDTIDVDGQEIEAIKAIVDDEAVDVIVVGFPRNQAGEPTTQSEFVEQFSDRLVGIVDEIVFQDESLTSVKAEELLKRQNQPYGKGDIDALAASLILQDYLEAHHGRL